jgi:ABC-2 type transport system ATP-binding protein
VLLLDEPTAGLDPLMEAVFQDCLLEVRARGATVLLSSHILAEVEKICDRVTIIRNGRAVETGTLADLRVLSRTSFVVTLVGDGAPLQAIAGVHNLQRRGKAWIFESEPAALEAVMHTLASIGVASVESHPPTLEEIFLRHYDDAPRTVAGG